MSDSYSFFVVVEELSVVVEEGGLRPEDRVPDYGFYDIGTSDPTIDYI